MGLGLNFTHKSNKCCLLIKQALVFPRASRLVVSPGLHPTPPPPTLNTHTAFKTSSNFTLINQCRQSITARPVFYSVNVRWSYRCFSPEKCTRDFWGTFNTHPQCPPLYFFLFRKRWKKSWGCGRVWDPEDQTNTSFFGGALYLELSPYGLLLMGNLKRTISTCKSAGCVVVKLTSCVRLDAKRQVWGGGGGGRLG